MNNTERVGVLIVDDSIDILDTMSALLMMKGYSVIAAATCEQALGMISESRPLCVILDVLMPGMDGAAFARRLRDDFGDDIVLIAISGYPEAHPRVLEAFKIVDHYLQKPIDTAALDRVLPDLL